MDSFGTRIVIVSCCFIALIVFSYHYIDRPVAVWLHYHNSVELPFLSYLTYFPNALTLCVIPYYIAYMIFYLKKSLSNQLQQGLAIANSIAIADFSKDYFKFLFGRYWPKTWTFNNPSLISHNAYGFHFFHASVWYQSFPSGHAAVTTAAMTIVWLVYPRWRWLAALVTLLVVLSVVGMNYHFVSDVLAGIFIGISTALCVAKLSKLI